MAFIKEAGVNVVIGTLAIIAFGALLWVAGLLILLVFPLVGEVDFFLQILIGMVSVLTLVMAIGMTFGLGLAIREGWGKNV